jgi:predicted GNAT superfamily acetyltransferase
LPDRIDIEILEGYEEFEKLIDIQRAVWGHPDLDLTPVHQFCVSSRMGAILLGASVARELVGFVYSFPAVLGKRPCQHSHLLAVLPEYRGRGIGKLLKWAQRKEALRRGYEFLTWTFDPLQARNANLNLQALGAISRTYFHNFYGMTPALCLGPGIPTDRLLIEWPVRELRVRSLARGAGKTLGIDAAGIPKALERRSRGSGPFVRPDRPRLGLRSETLLVEVPRDIKPMEEDRPGLLAEWQGGLRRTMTHYFGRGYRADHFLHGERCFYVLRKDRPAAARSKKKTRMGSP